MLNQMQYRRLCVKPKNFDRDLTRTIVPYKTKIVESISLIPRDERYRKIEDAGLNLFNLKSNDVYIDLLTDSGTGSISNQQLANMMVGDESYAGSRSFHRMVESFQDVTGLPYVIPAHQGRGAEQVLNSIIINDNQIVLGNTHFDTTKAHIEFSGGRCLDCTIEDGKRSQGPHPFKGNIDLRILKRSIVEHGAKNIAYILINVTCNSGGGQPVSMENIKAVEKMARQYSIPLFFDAARFAENAYFIKQREEGYENKSIREIVKEMFSYVDGCTMSAKKDGIVPMGGLIAVRDEGLYDELKTPTILFEGFYTYGGMSGMMMEALAQGVQEVIEEHYLRHRIGQASQLWKWFMEVDIPLVEPIGGHAVFVDGRRFYPEIPEDQFPAQLLCVELYKEGGVRAVEIGANLIGRDPDTGENIRPALDLCRLAIPRRTYTKEHMEYLVDVIKCVRDEQKERTTGLTFLKETPGIRHFTSTFKPSHEIEKRKRVGNY